MRLIEIVQIPRIASKPVQVISENNKLTIDDVSAAKKKSPSSLMGVMNPVEVLRDDMVPTAQRTRKFVGQIRFNNMAIAFEAHPLPDPDLENINLDELMEHQQLANGIHILNKKQI